MKYRDAFAEYIEQNGLPYPMSSRFRTVQEIAVFVANPENFDGGFTWWRDYALEGASSPEHLAQQVMIVRGWDDTRALLETSDTPESLFERVNYHLKTILLEQGGASS